MKDSAEEATKLLLASSKNLAQFVASSSFEFWERKDFRLYVNFDNISQTEQDRMFNELEVSILGLFILHFDYAISMAKDEYKIVLQMMQKELSASFLALLSEGGIERKYLTVWEKLIKMRLKEYREDFRIALKMSRKMKEFKGEDELRLSWARIETITIDCLRHIKRGQVEEKDPLWKLLRKWLITLDAQLNPISKLAATDGVPEKN